MTSTRATVAALLLALLLVVDRVETVAAVDCCNCIGCPAGVSACLTEPAEVDVCAKLGCTGVSNLCLPGNCTAGREEICPATEAGQCNDGVDNDFNGQVDCADSVCVNTIFCRPAESPVLDPLATGVLLAALAAIEVWRRRRATRRA